MKTSCGHPRLKGCFSSPRGGERTIRRAEVLTGAAARYTPAANSQSERLRTWIPGPVGIAAGRWGVWSSYV